MQDADTAADSDPFAEAFGAPEAVTSTADDGGAQNADGGGQPRDEGGRFASKQEDSADQPTAGGQEQPQPKPEPEKDHRIPIRELLDERDRRQAAEREKQELLQRLAAYERQHQQPPQRPDPIADPDAYAEYMDDTMGGRIQSAAEEARMAAVNLAFDLAVDQHGQEAVDTAMGALEATGDRALAASIKNAVNPAKALMKWHSRHKAQAEVGDDLDGYLARKREEWLSDPAVREQVLAKAREEAGGRSSTSVTDLPSLNRVPGNAGSRPGTTEPEVFQSAFGARRRA